MSRTIFAAILGLGLICNLGCGSKPQPQPEQPNAVLTPEPKVELPPPVVKVNHEMDPAKHVIPPGSVTGRIGGVDVTAEARIEGQNLVLQKPEAAPGDNWRVSIELPVEPGREGSPQRMVLKPEDVLGPTGWTVFVNFPRPVIRQWEVFSFKGSWADTNPLGWRGGCAITLEWGKRENGKLPGKVFLAIPDLPELPSGNVLAGTFVADCPRQANDPPGPDDVPYVKGAVAVRGAAPNANLKVGYVGALAEERFCLGATVVDLDARQYARSNYDKPHVSTLIAGDGKAVPSQYEHSKLTPGRYLVFASIQDGPMTWRWVEVKPGATLTVDLSLDAAMVGGLEIVPPLEEVTKVQMAPVDMGQPPPTDGLFEGIALQLGLEAKIVARKAKFTNLAPGRYEVRAAKQTRTIEIVAGKTVELDFEKK
ncbi:MAG: hypothetical protein C0467_07945 [Planctomycetaceae bacterium]|nr:hypothetical protein [Planctomycetaceae bacterium]